jgi:rhomboid protease GluP
MNIFVGLAIVFVWSWSRIGFQGTWAIVIASMMVGIAVIKGFDVILSMKKGLAAVVIILALVNATLIFVLADLLSAAATSFCVAGVRNSAAAIVAKACTNASVVIGLASMGAFALTFLFYWPQFARGMADVGFIGAALRGERERRWGV